MSKLEKLTFTISLLDRVSKPIRKVQKVIGSMADASEKAFRRIGTGAAGVAGAGYSLAKFINPAEEMRQALGEVASLDVGDDVLKGLSRQALQYSIKYGRAADGFVRSAYDIQSAIGGLQGNDLATFTNAGNVLATATKSDASTITNYMGTMYGIFQKQADKMGKAEWVEQLAGQTATAVKMFKTTGSEMSAAFTAVGANATSAGIGAVEQMAILGKLQATMSGSESGTKYKAFLAGVGKAQKKLGLSFVDSNNNLLSMVDILGLLKGKFGDTLNVAESDALKDAFGSDEAVSLIKLLMADTGGLVASMDKLGKVRGMEQAERMAAKMVTPLQRVSQGVKAIAISLGSALNPVLDPFINAMANGAATITKWNSKFPHLARLVGQVTLAVLGLTAVMGTLAVVGGLASLVFSPIILIAGAVVAALVGVIFYWGKIKALFQNTAWGQTVLKVFDFILLPLRLAIYLVNQLITHWDALKAAFMDSTFGKVVLEVLGAIGKALGVLWESAKSLLKVFTTSLDWWSKATDFLPSLFGGGSEAPKTSPSLDAPRRAAVAQGGVTSHVAKTFASHRSDTRTVGVMNVYTEQPTTKSDLTELVFEAS